MITESHKFDERFGPIGVMDLVGIAICDAIVCAEPAPFGEIRSLSDPELIEDLPERERAER